MAKKGTESVRIEEFKKYVSKYGDRFIRLYDTFTAGGFGGSGFRRISIPSQGCDAIVIRGGDSVAFQIEFKSVQDTKFGLLSLSNHQIDCLKNSSNIGINSYIVLDYVLQDKTVSTYISGDFYKKYEETRNSRPYKTMNIDVKDLIPLGLPYFSTSGLYYGYEDKLVKHIESLYLMLVKNFINNKTEIVKGDEDGNQIGTFGN